MNKNVRTVIYVVGAFLAYYYLTYGKLPKLPT